ncbi:MAG: HAMP domain-containing sensor histidine kinase [Planctomycetaceae bacterium]
MKRIAVPPMKLAARLILIFLAGVLCIVGISAWLSIEQHHAWEEYQRESHDAQLVDAMTPAIMMALKDDATVTLAQAVQISSRGVKGKEFRVTNDKEVMVPERTITAREISSISVTNGNGTRTAHTFVPLVIDGIDSGTVQISQSLEPHDAFIRRQILSVAASLAGVALLSGLVIYVGGIRLVARPLKKLFAQIDAIGRGQLDQPPALSGNDEFGRLALAISNMSRRLREQRDTIRHTDRLGTVGTLAAGIAHELGTPLNVVSGQAALIAGGRLTAEEVQGSARDIKEEADRMTAIIRQLLDFARRKPAERRVFDLPELVRRTCGLMEPLAHKAGVRVRVEDIDSLPCVTGEPSQLQQVFTNLISNAVAALPDGGDVRVSVSATDDGKQVCVEVSDTGTGISAEDLPRVFEPFFTTKDVGLGTGLGLSIAYGIIREHGGEISVRSTQGQGTSFRITLPLTDASGDTTHE